MPQHTILILAANPRDTQPLRLDQEVRDIRQALRGAIHRDQFTVESRLAVRIRDLRQALLDLNPSFVHFSGHGTGEAGIVLENDAGKPQLVTAAALADFFSFFTAHLQCVLLNACFSQVQADAIVTAIPYAIGMQQSIADRAAILFAEAFYDALGAGRSIDDAFGLGCNTMHLEGMVDQAAIPVLKKKV